MNLLIEAISKIITQMARVALQSLRPNLSRRGNGLMELWRGRPSKSTRTDPFIRVNSWLVKSMAMEAITLVMATCTVDNGRIT